MVMPIVAALGGRSRRHVSCFDLPNGEASRGGRSRWRPTSAFVVGILALFGKAAPPGLKTFLLTLAIIDAWVPLISSPRCLPTTFP